MIRRPPRSTPLYRRQRQMCIRDNEFTAHLDSALVKEYIVFDNEPVLHVPYLFNYAHHPDQSQKWVKMLMNTHYSATPDGLPGNDDLGSMSSWYVFSAMGFF